MNSESRWRRHTKRETESDIVWVCLCEDIMAGLETVNGTHPAALRHFSCSPCWSDCDPSQDCCWSASPPPLPPLPPLPSLPAGEGWAPTGSLSGSTASEVQVLVSGRGFNVIIRISITRTLLNDTCCRFARHKSTSTYSAINNCLCLFCPCPRRAFQSLNQCQIWFSTLWTFFSVALSEYKAHPQWHQHPSWPQGAEAALVHAETSAGGPTTSIIVICVKITQSPQRNSFSTLTRAILMWSAYCCPLCYGKELF